VRRILKTAPCGHVDGIDRGAVGSAVFDGSGRCLACWLHCDGCGVPRLSALLCCPRGAESEGGTFVSGSQPKFPQSPPCNIRLCDGTLRSATIPIPSQSILAGFMAVTVGRYARAGLLVGRARMSPRRSSGASHEGGQTSSGHENAKPILLAPREFLVTGRLGRCFLRGLRCRPGRSLFAGLSSLLRSELLLDGRGDCVNVHLVDVHGIAENLRGVGLIVHGQEND